MQPCVLRPGGAATLQGWGDGLGQPAIPGAVEVTTGTAGRQGSEEAGSTLGDSVSSRNRPEEGRVQLPKPLMPQGSRAVNC